VIESSSSLRWHATTNEAQEVIVLSNAARSAAKLFSPLRVAVIVGALATAIVALPPSDSEARDRTVSTKGDNRMSPNSFVQSTLRFSPGRISLESGDTLTLEHDDKTQDPHTLTIANEDELPQDFDETFNCGSPGTICGDAFDAIDPSVPFFDAPGTAAGIDGRLDNLWVNAGESASAIVSAPSGSELFFICIIHPWMQGEIRVR
jgi:plastocyanin